MVMGEEVTEVAVKEIRSYPANARAIRRVGDRSLTQSTPPNVLISGKRALREAELWKPLNHSNIVPFIATIDPQDNSLPPQLVSKWARHGNVEKYLAGGKREERVGCIPVLVRGFICSVFIVLNW
jgi:hypothetical protein